MSIRTKIGIILLLAVFGIGIAEYCIQRCVVLPGFFELEQEEAREDAHRLVKNVENEINHLGRVCTDWAQWDDTYAFMENHSPRYIQSNLVPETFINNRINLICIYSLSGHPEYSRIYDLKSQVPLCFNRFSRRGSAGGSPNFPPASAEAGGLSHQRLSRH